MKTANANLDHMSASARQSFQVVFCTGSDAGFPVTELNEHSPHTKGWQSPRFCEYPQEIGIEHVKNNINIVFTTQNIYILYWICKLCCPN